MLHGRAFPLCLLVVLLAGSACAGRGGIPRQPFPDIPVPASFIPYSDRWVRIRTDRADVARLIYMTELGPEGAAAAERELLLDKGWALLLTNRTSTPDGYRVIVLDFAKEPDTIRATFRQGEYATHVDLSVARVTPR